MTAHRTQRTVIAVKVRRCKNCKHRMFDVVERCETCGARTLRWYVRVIVTIAFVVIAIALLIFVIHTASQPTIERLPPPE